jgi:hypothetical protein
MSPLGTNSTSKPVRRTPAIKGKTDATQTFLDGGF